MVCGIDEAGRGPIAGPIVIAGVVLIDNNLKLDDSKKLTPIKREQLYKQIKQKSIYKINIYHSNQIDKIGLSKIYDIALNDIMTSIKADTYILDGNTNYGVLGVNPVIKADSKIQEVSAASILAKVTRDKIMCDFAKLYPAYHFESHKGYCTKKHLEAIKKYGYCDIHRRSFKIKI
jgi:ribonuclease HII